MKYYRFNKNTKEFIGEVHVHNFVKQFLTLEQIEAKLPDDVTKEKPDKLDKSYVWDADKEKWKFDKDKKDKLDKEKLIKDKEKELLREMAILDLGL